MPLPRWATLIPRAPSAGHDPVSLAEEEAYVRCRCFHQASRTLDAAFQASLERQGIHNKLVQLHETNTNKSKQTNYNDDTVGSRMWQSKRGMGPVPAAS